MNIALVMTTINIPTVLELYRRHGPDVHIIVVGDYKTDPGAAAYCHELDCHYLSVDDQKALGYKVSELIGWNCVMRRSIGVLEAVRSGADVIVTVDDDNIPKYRDYFEQVEAAFEYDVECSMAESVTGFFNLGDFAIDRYTYRGYPFTLRSKTTPYTFRDALVKVGILNGLIYGDPDISAAERIIRNPDVRVYQTRATDGIALAHDTWSPVNAQNTAWARELSPLAFCASGIGRYDDIWGSYIAQQVMSGTDYHVMFGQPHVNQKRGVNNGWKNTMRCLKDEIMGMEYTEDFIKRVKCVPMHPDDIMGNYSRIADELSMPLYIDMAIQMRAWLEDVCKIL